MVCAYKKCNKDLSEDMSRVEVRTILPKSLSKALKSKFFVDWKTSGEASFHQECWDVILKSSRSWKKKSNIPHISGEEKILIKEAAKTAEFFNSVEHIKKEAKRVAKMISSARHCVAFTGAGISTSAGIGDYRGKSGKWTKMDQESIDVSSVFEHGDGEPSRKKMKTEETKNEEDEEGSDDYEEEDGVPYESLRPTYTHEALKKLLELGNLKYIISQNGDGLHTLSGIPQDKISELHGNVFAEKCERCGKQYDRPYYVMDDIGSQYFEELEDYRKTDVKKPAYAVKCERCGLSHRTGRKCEDKKCRGYLIDTIINFGDMLEDRIFDGAMDNATECDVMLCLGSTLKVTPASDLVESIMDKGRLVICNRQPTHLDKECSKQGRDGLPLGCRIFGDCDFLMKEVMAAVLTDTELKTWEAGSVDRRIKYDSMRVKSAQQNS